MDSAMIKIEKVSKTYGKHLIVDNLTLKVANGKVFGFLGPNGAGKTTTIKMLVGLNRPDSGKISIDGRDPAEVKTRKKIGFMPENPYFYDRLTGLELLKFCYTLSSPTSFPRTTMSSSPTTMPSPPTSMSSPRRWGSTKADSLVHENDASGAPDEILRNILEKVGLSEARNKMVRTYSKGMKQRLSLAQAIIHDPDYIFLDEPLDGLDPIGRMEIKEVIKKLKSQGKTIFFNSHILSDVEEICDEIGIINDGKLIYFGSVKKFGPPLEKKFVELIQKSKIKDQSNI